MALGKPVADIRLETPRGFTPEQNLVAEVIWRAVCDVSPGGADPTVNGGRPPKREVTNRHRWLRNMGYLGRSRASAAHSARMWLTAKTNKPWSFLWCCEVIGVSPDMIRGYANGL